MRSCERCPRRPSPAALHTRQSAAHCTVPCGAPRPAPRRAPRATSAKPASRPRVGLGCRRLCLLAIFSLVPLESRAVAGCVCHNWRRASSDRSLWKAAALASYAGKDAQKILVGVAARAGGQLEILKLREFDAVPKPTLSAVLQANRGALRELHLGNFSTAAAALTTLTGEHDIRWLLRELPSLSELHVATHCAFDGRGRAMLRNEPPYGPLRLHALCFRAVDTANLADLAALLAAYPHECLKTLSLSGMPLSLPAAAEALFDAALALRVAALEFSSCQLRSATVPALARVVSGQALTYLHIAESGQGDPPLFDAPSSALLAAALRGNTSLTLLSLRSLNLGDDVAPFNAILAALVGHPTLVWVQLYRLWGAAVTGVGPALGALLAANAPALRELWINVSLGDDGAQAVVHGLAQNTHLRLLEGANHWGLSRAFLAHQLLPVVRAHPALRPLRANGEVEWAAARSCRHKDRQ